MYLLDSSVVDHQSISLGAVTTKDGCSLEGEIKGFGESQAGVTEEANLHCSESMVLLQKESRRTWIKLQWVTHAAGA